MGREGRRGKERGGKEGRGRERKEVGRDSPPSIKSWLRA